MRVLVLVTTAAVVVFGTPAFAAATPSISDQSALAADSSQTTGVRLAQGKGPPNPHPSGTDAGNSNQQNNPACERKGQTASPSSPNNGFGNCGNDGIPGQSIKTPGKEEGDVTGIR